jgi:hypothetical protein
MKKIILLAFVFNHLSMFSYSQNMGIGIRLGDPAGITFKKYSSKNALEVNIGRSYLFNGNKWYNTHFNYWYNKQNYNYKEYQYLGYGSGVPVALQLHYLFRNPVKSTQGLEWYWGFGGQMRFQRYYYSYRYKLHGDPNWYYAYDQAVTDIDLGFDGVLGMEYNFKDIPLALFADINIFMEIIDRPFLFWFQGGLGVRYNFK